ncbi:Inositolphosphorylceramide synthase subunit Kei1-domain-containing protein [Podospora appendiculata]|uniref:Inositolphosphorylceramide synthase subunit Kei1-domain-containing protein n=1 Tax=Podospora appendiculata TaxID=314037 RepID=A0AAE1CBA6_9PEZI|nr:Inositolphosphorylceramide synthase subunit Kei1-domain-containing protein [Podospora appendiculata]
MRPLEATFSNITDMSSSPRSCQPRLPRPRTFLGLMSLQTGTELISLALVFNKATGIYGILALFTGYALSALQISAYILSLLIIVALCYLVPHVRKQSPFQNLALAWLYLIDTFVNIAYTSVFAVTWYQALLHESKGSPEDDDYVSSPRADQYVDPELAAAARADAAEGVKDTAASMVLVVLFTLVRVYFSLVVMAFARMVLQKYVEANSGWTPEGNHVGPLAPSDPSDIFAVGSPAGEGLKGRLGRMMISVGKGYWLGRKDDEEWARDVGSKFRSRAHS